MEKKTILLIKESAFSSWFKDTYTFGCFFAMVYLNHRLCSGSWIIDLAITIFIIGMSLNRGKQYLYTVNEALEEIQKLARQDTKESAPQPTTAALRKGAEAPHSKATS